MDSPEEGVSNVAWEGANSGRSGLDTNTDRIHACCNQTVLGVLSKDPQVTIWLIYCQDYWYYIQYQDETGSSCFGY